MKLYKQLNSVDSFTHSYIYINLYMLPFKTFAAAVYSCLVNAFKFIKFVINISQSSAEKCIALTLVRSESSLHFADALHVSCDWLFAACVTLSGAHTPELITN